MAEIQYKTTVSWDVTLADVAFADSSISSGLKGLAISALKITTGAPQANAGYFAPGAQITNTVDSTIYRNTGSTASPVWSIIDTGAFVVVLAGTVSGSTTATRVYAIAGLLATDFVTANITASTNAVTIQKITKAAGQITILFSGDPGAGTTVDYQAVRAAS